MNALPSLIADLREARERIAWRPIESAPRGGGAELITDPNWVQPPEILLLFKGFEQRVGAWDWYYAEGGSGEQESHGCGWVEPTSGELLGMNYDPPTHWMPLPDAPARIKELEEK